MNPITSLVAQNSLAFFLLILWSLFWQAVGCWYAARNKQKYWFIAFFIIHTVGLLEIAYLLWFLKKDRFWEKIFRPSEKN